MTPPSSPARLALFATVAFVLAFGVGAAGASLLESKPTASTLATRTPADPAFARLGGNVAVAIVPIGGGAITQLGDAKLLDEPGGNATTAISIALVTAMRSAPGGRNKLTQQEVRDGRAAITRPDDQRATDRLGHDLDSMLESAAQARAAVADLSGAVATNRPGTQPYRELGWPAGAQAQFLAELAGGCLLEAADTQDVLAMLAVAGSKLRWGFGARREASSPPLVLTGAGESQSAAHITRQLGIVALHGTPVAVATVALTNDEPSGKVALTELADWVTRYAKAPVTGTRPCA